MLALGGTIPVVFSGSTYNIPVCLYLLDTHPYHPPACYVKPTPDMMIKPSRHVDSQGRIYLPYLSEWAFPACSTHDLVQVLALTFADECPVFAKSAANVVAPAAALPYPSGPGSGMPQPGRSPGFSFRQPAPTNYPPHQPPPAATGQPPFPSRQQPPYPYANQQSSGNAIASAPDPEIADRMGCPGTIQPEHFRASLVSAVQDRVRARLQDALGTVYAEVC